MAQLKLWVGLECTYNRVGATYHSQLHKSGHHKRLDDLDKFASLGAERIRYPCIWELNIKGGEGVYDWSWLDQRLHRLRDLNLRPIAGFLHHGSGPKFTDLLDPEFPEKLARYAADFARRYPWIEDYTPVNEILTTARFSCLYGYWYPHKKDDVSFLQALYNQCKATVLAMRAIREVNPKARLIQTEDLGKAQSTSTVAYQAEFENHRRWIALDLLCGKVTTSHPIYDFLKIGISDEQLKWLVENPCPPDVFGINHYLLSNRFLDEELELYPEFLRHTGNRFHRYVDVGAIDTERANTISPKEIFKEAWERYKIPLAVTEVHIRGHREDQIRWFYDIWKTAEDLKKEGVEFEAVTAWSLLGSFDWDSLCTERHGFYEPGVFDLRSPKTLPRPTALSSTIKKLAQGNWDHHPIFDEPGWWQKGQRKIFALHGNPIHHKLQPRAGKALLITGANGTLAKAFARICEFRNIPYYSLSRNELDTANKANLQRILKELRPWAVVNAAGYVKVDLAETEIEKCFRENVEAPTNLAEECALAKIPLVTFSSDLVFNGLQDHPYVESDPVAPLNIYGTSKAQAEEKVLTSHSEALVIRTSSFFGPWDQHNFVFHALRAVSNEKQFAALQDIKITPTYVPDLVHATLDLLIDKEHGIIHLTNEADITWADLATLAVEAKVPDKKSLIQRCTLESMPPIAQLPRNSALVSERCKLLPTLEDALFRYFKDLEVTI